MSPRNTKTGGVLEAMILPALKNGDYKFEKQVEIGMRIGGRKHVVDVLADKNGIRIPVSLKWQQVAGTAEQKIPFEVICLAEAVVDSKGKYSRSYLVLGGEGWTLRDFYTSGGLEKFLACKDKVKITTLETFVALANRGKL